MMTDNYHHEKINNHPPMATENQGLSNDDSLRAQQEINYILPARASLQEEELASTSTFQMQQIMMNAECSPLSYT